MTTTYNRSQVFPPYPRVDAPRQKYTPHPFGPPDLRPSGLGPGYSFYQGAHGRNLAGVSSMKSADQIETYPNELQLLAELDDVQNNGVFDANLTHGNIHPEYGVFNDHQSLPGYVARDVFYSASEVTDLTTGKPVNYVPGGAVSFQQGQEENFNKNLAMYLIPKGIRADFRPEEVDEQSTVVPEEYEMGIPRAIGSLGEVGTGDALKYGVAIVLGAALGYAASRMLKTKRR
jgi:hypothetical protein